MKALNSLLGMLVIGLAIINLIFLFSGREFAVVYSERHQKYLNLLKTTTDLVEAKQYANQELSWLYAANRAAYDSWKFSTMVGIANLLLLVLYDITRRRNNRGSS